MQAYVDEVSVELTPTEFRLLYTLALDQGRVADARRALQKIWGRRLTRRDRTVDVFIRKLREKIDAKTHQGMPSCTRDTASATSSRRSRKRAFLHSWGKLPEGFLTPGAPDRHHPDFFRFNPAA